MIITTAYALLLINVNLTINTYHATSSRVSSRSKTTSIPYTNMGLRRKQIICELYHASSSTKSCDIYKRCLATLNVRYLLRANVSPRQRLTKGQPPTQPRWQVYKSVSSNSCATSGHRQMLYTPSADYSVGKGLRPWWDAFAAV